MVSWMISRTVVLAFGILYPAYSSYKAVKTKNVKEYVKWMMYWIVFAIFTTVETATDLVLSWFPFYFELKIAFVIWLLSPYTKGSSVLYRKFVHPTLSKKEKECFTTLDQGALSRAVVPNPLLKEPQPVQEIDEYISQAKDRSYDTMMRFGKRGLNLAANAAVTAASKGQDVLSEKLRSFSMHDLTLIQDEDEIHLRKADARQRGSSSHGDDVGVGGTLPRARGTSRQARVTPPSTDESRPSSRADGDQSDARAEQLDEDAAERAPKRAASVKAKKPAVAKTESKTAKKQPKKKTSPTGSATAETP